MTRTHYDRSVLALAMREVGVRPGDVVFSHGNVGYFGYPREGQTTAVVCDTVLGAFLDALGPEGTLVVPTYTLSFCRGEAFDPDASPSTCGVLTETLRLHPGGRRSWDPNFSVGALGPRAGELTDQCPIESFGPRSFWERLYEADGIICNLNFDAGSTYIHYVERCLNVPYRYNKPFGGDLVVRGTRRSSVAIHYCQDLSNPDTVAAFEAFDRLARQEGLARTVRVGRGALVAIRARDVFKLIEREIRRNPWFLTVAGAQGRAPVLVRPANIERYRVELPPQAPMTMVVGALSRLPRHLVSDGHDAALQAIGRQIDLRVHAYATGHRVGDMIVPERWECSDAFVQTPDGRQVLSAADQLLRVVSYSQPFAGEVSRRVLLEHLHVHPDLDDALPARTVWPDRSWAVAASRRERDALTEDRYRVSIRTSFGFGSLSVGEVVVPGANPGAIALAAVTGLPTMANEGLSGVAVGLAVMRSLAARRDRRHTYRLVLVPGQIGLGAYLSDPGRRAGPLVACIVLEALGLTHALGVRPLTPDLGVLGACAAAIPPSGRGDGGARGAALKASPFAGDWRAESDIPLVVLSRALPVGHAGAPYAECRSSLDTAERVCAVSMEKSRDAVLGLIDRLERESLPA